MELTNRTVLVTGGSSGIGLELARQLVARGNTVVVTGRDAARLDEAVARVPGLHAMRADVSDAGAMAGVVDGIRRDFAALDVLVNNAGVMHAADFRRGPDLPALADEIAINLTGPVRLVSMLLPLLQARPAALVVNVSSGLAYAPFPAAPVYSATKAALHSFTQSLRVQLAHTSVRVVEVFPPTVDTPMLAPAMREAMKGQALASPSDVARRAIAGIEAGEAEIRIGASRALRWLSRLAPGLLMRQMAGMYAAHP